MQLTMSVETTNPVHHYVHRTRRFLVGLNRVPLDISGPDILLREKPPVIPLIVTTPKSW